MKHRKTVVASFLALILVTGAVAALSIYSFYSARASAGLPGALSSIPSDYPFVFGMNVRQLTASPFYQKLRQESPQTLSLGDDLANFTEQTGLDPARDIASVIVASGPRGSAKPEGLLIVSGDFNRERITSYIRAKAAPAETEIGGVQVMLVPDKKNANVQNGMAFLNEHEIASGSLDSLKAAFDTRSGARKSILANPTVTGLLDGIDLNSMFWFAGDASGAIQQSPIAVPAGLNASAVQSVSGAFNFGENFVGSITATAADASAATKLADLVRGVMALGQLSGNQNPDLNALMSGIAVTQNAAQINLSFNIPGTLLQKMGKAKAAPKTSGADSAK
jgi:hypothetical protein